MEWVRQWGWDDIPYMKWKIIHSCSKPPTRWDFVMGIKSATYDEEKSKVLVRPDQKSCADVCLIFRYWGSKPLPGQEKNHGIFFFEFSKEPTKKVDSFHTSTTPCDIRATLAPASKGTTLLGPNRNPAGSRCGGRYKSQIKKHHSPS